MKKVIYFCFICVIVLLCSACNGSITRGIRHAGFNVGKKFTCDRFYPKDKEDTNYDKIRYFTGSHLINEDGVIYEVSLDQVFSNEQNCKVADTSIVVKAIMDNKIIKASDGKYYYLVGGDGIPSYSEVTKIDNNYDTYDLLLKDSNVVKIITVNLNMGIYYTLKNDGNIYEIIVYKKDHNSVPEITSSRIVYDKGEFGGDIIDFNYVGNSENTYIKTVDRIYRMQKVNKKECLKYADVKCIYEMSEDAELEEYLDKIIVYNGSTIITDYKQVFSLQN